MNSATDHGFEADVGDTERARRHLATAMYYGIVGLEWNEAKNMADAAAMRAVAKGGDIATALRIEAARYEDM